MYPLLLGCALLLTYLYQAQRASLRTEIKKDNARQQARTLGMEKILSQTLNDNVADSILFYDPDQKLFACNSAMTELLRENLN